MFKKLVDKIKFLFRAKEMDFEFSNDESVDVESVAVQTALAGPCKSVKNEKFMWPEYRIYHFNKEKDRLEQILLKTKKFRIRKKLRNRIEKSF